MISASHLQPDHSKCQPGGGWRAGPVPTLAWVTAAWVHVCPPSLSPATLCPSQGQPPRATWEPRAGQQWASGREGQRAPRPRYCMSSAHSKDLEESKHVPDECQAPSSRHPLSFSTR